MQQKGAGACRHEKYRHSLRLHMHVHLSFHEHASCQTPAPRIKISLVPAVPGRAEK